MTKLIIQIPCFNEAETLGIALGELPREVPGFDRVEWLIIDDGSSDDTAEVADRSGVDHIVRHQGNKGLAQAFMTGINACLRLGADVILNTDADNQYNAHDIPLLTEPIIEGKADLVIGQRPIATIDHFSPLKKFLQKLGSWVVRVTSRTQVADAPSGFRAMTRDAAQQFVVFNNYTYTLETIIQAGRKNMRVVNVPIRVNGDLRPSRLVRSIPSYIQRSILTIVRIFVIYQPARFFGTIALGLLGLGAILSLRFLYYYLNGEGTGHVQSVIMSGVLLTMGFQSALVAFLGDVIAANRRLLEEVRYNQRVNLTQNAKVPSIQDREDI